MRLKSKRPTPELLAARKTLEAALKQHEHLDPIDMCAVTAHFLGQLIALQDQTRFTPAQVMEVVAQNIEVGNKEVLDSLLNETGGRA